jgi:hypothetical protein
MKRSGQSPDNDEMPAEFDFSRSIPNPWLVTVHGADYVRVIDKDLAALFPDDESMNAALRSIQKTRSKRANTASAPKPKKKKHD